MIGYSKEIERYFLDCDGCGLRLESEPMVSLLAKTFEDLIREVLDKGWRIDFTEDGQIGFIFCPECWRNLKGVKEEEDSKREEEYKKLKKALALELLILKVDAVCSDLYETKRLVEELRKEKEEDKKIWEEAIEREFGGRVRSKREEEYKKLKKVLNGFSEMMLAKLMKKYDEDGYTGWDRENFKEVLISGLKEHIHKCYSDNFSPSSLIDIANYCMFLWYLNSKGGEVR